MTMGPQEAFNVMEMAQNISSLNTKVMVLEAKVQRLEQMLSGQQDQGVAGPMGSGPGYVARVAEEGNQ